MIRRALFGLALLGACTPVPDRADAPGGFVLAADGLRVEGTSLEIGFGRAQLGAIAAITKVLGRGPSRQYRVSCGQVIAWPNLAVTFTQGAFVGWSARPGAFPAMPGVGTTAGRVCG